MKKRFLALMAVAAIAMTGCGNAEKMTGGASNSFAADSAASESWNGGFSDYDSGAGVTADNKGGTSQEYGQKLIYTYDYSFETLEFDASMAYVERKVAEYGGYIERSESRGNKSRRYATFTVRIPGENCAAFLNETGEIGEIIYKTSSSDDVTIAYYDAKSRLQSLNTQHDRLIELLAQSGSLSDIVELEAHLADVEYEIDRYTTMLRVYDNKIDYVTINFTINEVEQIQVVEDDSFWTQIKKGFTSNTSSVINGFLDFVVFVVTSIPYFIVLAVIAVIVIFIVKKVKKASEKRSKERMDRAQSEFRNRQTPPYMPSGAGCVPNAGNPQQFAGMPQPAGETRQDGGKMPGEEEKKEK